MCQISVPSANRESLAKEFASIQDSSVGTALDWGDGGPRFLPRLGQFYKFL